MPQFEPNHMITVRLPAQVWQRLQVMLGKHTIEEAVDIYMSINEQAAQQGPSEQLRPNGPQPTTELSS
jgi:hypothetical protein